MTGQITFKVMKFNLVTIFPDLVNNFIEQNLEKLPIQIITGNSVEMSLIVEKCIKKYKLKSSPRTFYNLGCLVIDK